VSASVRTATRTRARLAAPGACHAAERPGIPPDRLVGDIVRYEPAEAA
jgi:hypothetical protein